MPRHSSSSRSSRSRSSGSRSRSRSRSSHSSRSRSSSYSGSHNYSSSNTVSYRTRTNQPTGYSKHKKSANYKSPVKYSAVKHDYIYYGMDWEDDGKYYKKGYYDENGSFYEDIIFARDGQYHKRFDCEYCNNNEYITWKEGTRPVCSNCGAEMNTSEIITDVCLAEPVDIDAQAKGLKIILGSLLGFILLPFLMTFGMFAIIVILSSVIMFSSSEYDAKTNVEIFGSTIYLKEIDENIYDISTQEDYDKKITWDYGEDCYYDSEADCFLWYNTDVSPNLWQYYYEGISTYYEDGCGWLECEGDTWYIETSPGNWEETFTDDRFWHIKNDFDE